MLGGPWRLALSLSVRIGDAAQSVTVDQATLCNQPRTRTDGGVCFLCPLSGTARVGQDRIGTNLSRCGPRSCPGSSPAPPSADLFPVGSAPVRSRHNDEALQSTSPMDGLSYNRMLCAGMFTTNEQQIGPTVFGTGPGGVPSNLPKRGRPVSERMGDGVTKAVSARG